MRKKILVLLLSVVCVVGLSVSAWAVTLWGTEVTQDIDLTGDHSFRDITTGGLSSSLDLTDTNFKIDWNVYQDGSSLWHYDYTLSWDEFQGGQNPTGLKAISHFITEVTQFEPFNIFEGTSFLGGTQTNPQGDEVPIIEGPTAWSTNGNPGIPNDFYGIKFDIGPDGEETNIQYSLVTDRVPEWGVFYAKPGNDGIWSSALDDPSPFTSEDKFDYIVRANGAQVPIPGAVWLLGSGLLGLVGLRARRKK